MSEKDYYVVGLGSSAGGLEAYQHLLPKLGKTNICYIICQHLSPHYKSMLSEILSRSTSMEVIELINGQELSPGKIFITPPNSNVEICEGKVTLSKPNTDAMPKPNINRFLTSLGQHYKDRTIGVILSGSGSDGAMGMASLHASGGFTAVQTPHTSSYDSMPKFAIQSNHIDFVGSPEEIAECINNYVLSDKDSYQERIKPTVYTAINQYVFSCTGIDFSQYRSSTMSRRIARRMSICRINEILEYFEYLKKNDNELSMFVQDAFIHVSEFFRDPQAFDEVKKTISKYLEELSDSTEFRIWVPGCATGEEAYTLAIIVDDLIRKNDLAIHYKVFATDIAEKAIDHARMGRYNLDLCVNIPKEYRERYFDATEDQLITRRVIRDNVVFSTHNLIIDPPFSKLHMVSCRNLLIYLNNALQDDIINVFNYALENKGILFLGNSENVQDVKAFSTINEKLRIYRKKMDNAHSLNAIKFRPLIQDKKIQPIENKRFSIEKELHKLLIEQHAPIGVVIDEKSNIIYSSRKMTGMLVEQEGYFNQNIIEQTPVEYRSEMRALIYKARRADKQAHKIGKQVTINNKSYFLKILIEHFHEERPDWLVAILTLQENNSGVPHSKHDGEKEDGSLVVDLEQELSATRENLQTVVEELETANEQLQIYNEELQSSNEEFQSTNEELQTVNEELQSTNEELITVNDELSEKSLEQERLTTDIFNIQESLDVPLFLLDHEFRILRFTKRCSVLVDTSRLRINDIFFSIPWLHDMPDIKKLFEEMVNDVLVRTEEILIGNSVYRCTISPYKGAEDLPNGTVVVFYDITNLKNIQTELALEKDIANMTLASLSEGVMRINDDYCIDYLNVATEGLLKWSADECLGKKVSSYLQLFESNKLVDLKNLIEKCVAEKRVFSPTDKIYILKTRYGEERKIELTISPVAVGMANYSTRATLTLKDVTEQQKHLGQLLWSSKHDSLTGLVNRKEVESRILHAIKSAKENNVESTLMYLDLDQFKVVNDTCGHMAGDQLLKQVSQLIENNIRSRDTLARLGGDEFAILLDNCKIIKAERLAKKILESISGYTFAWESRLFKIGVSIGIVAITPETNSVSSVLSNSDAACYSAKEGGRNRIEIHDSDNDLLEMQQSQMNVISDITDALENDGFRLYFQKIESLDENHSNVWEALVRMFNKQGEFLLPSKFLPAAERFGSIQRIDRWVLEQVVHVFGTYFDKSNLPTINVNMSANTVVDESYLVFVRQLIEDEKIIPEHICFELTETAAMANYVRAKNFVDEVRRLGCKVALDDFGTGTSSLAYLRELGVTTVKIDGMFATSLGTDDIDQTIVEAVTKVAHKLGMKVVVECIESEEQIQALKKLEVDYAQGYIITKPVPLEEFVSICRNSKAIAS
ncbi:EAL domain-containing protein [Agarilytica rhodophyticola]|uniref:EAL domain-containing protein n=1 Tax=Agarilytica rhodophyticola TaxID=1737490 RepID=UPI000B341230|nr:EAL domain-containing protein [Agarilytica rhodophyticola]